MLSVPRNAFVGSVNSQQVYVLENNNTVSLRKIIPGVLFGDTVDVLSGLEEGETVVVSGQINLLDGSQVAVIRNSCRELNRYEVLGMRREVCESGLEETQTSPLIAQTLNLTPHSSNLI